VLLAVHAAALLLHCCCCRRINILKPGEYFGEFSCLLGEARNGEAS
jgi:hypothetical protein